MSVKKFGLPEEDPLKLQSYLKKYKRQFWIQTVGGVLYNTVIVAGPIFLGKALDATADLERNGVTEAGIRSLMFYCMSLVLITIFFQYARYVKRWYIRDMSNRIACDIRAGLLSCVLKYPMEKLDRESIGDLMSRTVGDVEQIVSTMQTTINEAWDTWLLMISYFVVLLFYNPVITLLCSLPIPIAIYVAEWARHPLYKYSTSARKAASIVNSHLQRTLNGIAILRLFGREEMEKDRLQDFSTGQMNWNIKTSMLQTGMMPIYATLASLGVVGVIGLGSREVLAGNWTIGYFTAFLTMFTAMSTRTWVAARVFNQFHAAKAAWDRIKEKIGGHRDMDDATGDSRSAAETEYMQHANAEEHGRTAAEKLPYLEVSNLSFTYPGSSNAVLQDVGFQAERGSFIGVTGPVGSGKSTLALVLTGLYPYTGRIAVMGKDLHDFSGMEKIRTIAYAGQDSFLFSASIEHNITFGEPINDLKARERLDRALYVSALEKDLSLFPQGLQTEVGEKGIRVSGGQRQRIALARAIFTQNPVIILDDPFSAVDIHTEAKMIERIRKELKDTTVLVFSHRLAAFTGAQMVLVMDRGRVVEKGTHQELLQKKGIYEKIYGAQSWMEGEEHGA